MRRTDRGETGVEPEVLEVRADEELAEVELDARSGDPCEASLRLVRAADPAHRADAHARAALAIGSHEPSDGKTELGGQQDGPGLEAELVVAGGQVSGAQLETEPVPVVADGTVDLVLGRPALLERVPHGVQPVGLAREVRPELHCEVGIVRR